MSHVPSESDQQPTRDDSADTSPFDELMAGPPAASGSFTTTFRGYDKAEVFRYLAGMQKRTGKLDAAIATTKQGIAKHPDNKELMLDQVAFLLEANRMEEAEASVKTANPIR